MTPVSNPIRFVLSVKISRPRSVGLYLVVTWFESHGLRESLSQREFGG